MARFLRHYFGLGRLDPRLVLGSGGPSVRTGAIALVVLMYLGVLGGVVAAYFLEATRDAGALLPTLAPSALLRNFLVATLLFPLVAPKIMNLAGGDPNSPGDTHNFPLNVILQFCIAVQNGFFCQAVLM